MITASLLPAPGRLRTLAEGNEATHQRLNFILRNRIAHVPQPPRRSIMNSTPNMPEHPHNPTHFGGNGLYDSSGVEQVAPLKEELREQLDSASRQSLESLQRSTNSILDYVRRNPMRVAIGVAGVAALLAAWSRRRTRYGDDNFTL
jgi:hypothetical protein